MTNLRQRFREDTAATFEAYPPIEAVPSAATVTLYKPDGASELQAAAAMTVDTTSTTVSAASKDARSVTVASATGIVAGRRYLVTSAGRVYQAEVRSVSGTTIYLVGKLPFDVAANSTFKGWRATYALTTTHTADRNDNYQAAITWTISSAAHYSLELFDVVSAVEWYPTRLADVYARHPRAAWTLDAHDLDGYEALRTTWEQMLIPSLAARGMRIERVRDLRHLIPLHVAFVSEWLAEHDAMVDANLIASFELARQRRMEIEASVTSDVPWYDSDDDKAADSSEERRIQTYMEVWR